MGYFNPNISWSELERRLSGGATPEEILGVDADGEPTIPHPPVIDVLSGADEYPGADGGDLSLDLPGPQNGEPDPVGRHLLVLARGPEGYARLSTVIAEAHLAGGEKGKPVYDIDEVAAALKDEVLVLTGCRKGQVPATLLAHGMDAAATELDRLVGMFG